MTGQEEIEQQFRVLVESWLFGDGDVLSQQTRPMNFTLLALTCIGINALGNYLAGNTQRNNVKLFINEYMPEYNWLWEVGNWHALREGLMHQFLPKDEWVIVWAVGGDYVPVEYQRTWKKLDVLAFYRSFKTAALRYKQDLLTRGDLQVKFHEVLNKHSKLVVSGVSGHSLTVIRVRPTTSE